MDMADSGDGEVARRVEALPIETRRGVRAVEDALAHYSLDGDNLTSALEALRELLDTDKVLLYSLEPRRGTADLCVVRDVTVNVKDAGWRESFDDYLVGRGVSWGTFNPVNPEPTQRDRVLDMREVDALTRGRNRPIQELLYKRLDTVGGDTLRVLVCDGPSMLAWVGIVQPVKTTRRQRDLFELVVPAFRRRLKFDRIVSEAEIARGAVATALEQANGPAWFLGPGGRIEHANAEARAQLDADRAATLALLDRCIAGTAGPRFSVLPVRGEGGRGGHIVVETIARGAAQGVLRAAIRLGLTPAQTRVLEHVARGASNAAIAAELKVAERTVEAHITAILEKAQVPSRAALIVRIFA